MGRKWSRIDVVANQCKTPSILCEVFIKPDSFQFLQLELDSKKKELSEAYGRIEKHDEKVVSNFDYLRSLSNLSRNDLTAFPFPEIH